MTFEIIHFDSVEKTITCNNISENKIIDETYYMVSQYIIIILIEDNLNSEEYITSKLEDRAFIFTLILPLVGITSSLKYSLFRKLYINNLINTDIIYNCINNDEYINKLMHLYFGNDIPTFYTDITKCDEEQQRFYKMLDNDDENI